MKRVYQIFVFVYFVFLFTQSLYAAETAKPEKARLAPWGEVKLQYDDNVFLSTSNKKDDFIIALTPGVTGYLPLSDNLLKFDYHVDFIKFLDNSSQDATNHYVSGDLDLNWGDITLTIYDRFKHVYERPSYEDISRVKRDDNQAGIVAQVQTNRLGIQIGYENFMRDYKDSDYRQFDRQDHIYSLMLTHQTFDKTQLLFEYDYSQIRYDDSTLSDSNYHQFLVGAIGELTPKTTTTIKAGYQSRNYKQAIQPDFHSGVIYGDIIHKFSDKDSLKLSLSKTASESTYAVNNYYEVQGLSTTFNHSFTPKLLGFLTGLYQIHLYPRETTEDGVTQKRRDSYYSIGGGLRYYLQKWFTVTLQLEHILRDSNFRAYHYNQNLVTLTARAEF